jgi:hypothetical protein
MRKPYCDLNTADVKAAHRETGLRLPRRPISRTNRAFRAGRARGQYDPITPGKRLVTRSARLRVRPTSHLCCALRAPSQKHLPGQPGAHRQCLRRACLCPADADGRLNHFRARKRGCFPCAARVLAGSARSVSPRCVFGVAALKALRHKAFSDSNGSCVVCDKFSGGAGPSRKPASPAVHPLPGPSG